MDFLGCKDLRGHMDHQDKRVMLENLDFLERKGHEDPLEQLATLGIPDFLVFLARMVLQVPQVSQDAMVQREREGHSVLLACLDSAGILDHRGYQE